MVRPARIVIHASAAPVIGIPVSRVVPRAIIPVVVIAVRVIVVPVPDAVPGIPGIPPVVVVIKQRGRPHPETPHGTVVHRGRIPPGIVIVAGIVVMMIGNDGIVIVFIVIAVIIIIVVILFRVLFVVPVVLPLPVFRCLVILPLFRGFRRMTVDRHPLADGHRRRFAPVRPNAAERRLADDGIAASGKEKYHAAEKYREICFKTPHDDHLPVFARPVDVCRPLSRATFLLRLMTINGFLRKKQPP